MGTLTAASLTAAIFLILGWMVYRLLMENRIAFGESRVAILSIFVLSYAIMPGVKLIRKAIASQTASAAGMTSQLEIPDFTSEVATPLLWPSIILYAYFAGVIAFAVFTIIGYGRLFYIIMSGTRTRCEGYTLVETARKHIPFSWGRYIVINADEIDRALILRHELAHLNHAHWVDLLFTQVMCVLQWFNPAAWALRSRLLTVHEYQADASVLSSGAEPKSYQYLLLRQVTASHRFALTNSFDSSNLKKRIIMMNRNAKSNAWQHFRAMALVPALAIAFGLTQIPAVAAVIGSTAEAPLTMPTPAAEEKVAGSTAELEVKPEFPGGEGELMNWLAHNLKYPESMVTQEIEGREVVGFVVQPDGRVSNFSILRSVCPAADAEVMRLLSEMPLWKPGTVNGEPVACNYTLPITFKLPHKSNDDSSVLRIVSYETIRKNDKAFVVNNSNSQIYVNGKLYTGDINKISNDDIESISIDKQGSDNSGKARIDITLKKK